MHSIEIGKLCKAEILFNTPESYLVNVSNHSIVRKALKE